VDAKGCTAQSNRIGGNMKELSLHIHDTGDESVGIFSQSWDIDGILVEDDDHREDIRKSFREAFRNLICEDDFTVLFFDELPE